MHHIFSPSLSAAASATSTCTSITDESPTKRMAEATRQQEQNKGCRKKLA